VTEEPGLMFGKAMSISDELMARWYPVLLGRALDSSAHPMEAKKQLAGEIVGRFHNKDASVAARTEFESKFSKKDLSRVELPEHQVSENPIWIVKLLQDIKACASGGDARRLIQQGGVKLNDEKITDVSVKLDIKGGEILQAGKKTFVKLQP